MIRHSNKLMSIAVCASIGLTAACADTADDDLMVMDTGMASPTMGTDASATMTGAAWTDSESIAQVTAVNSSEIAAGQLAVEKAQNAEVRQFAQRMVDEHQRMQGEMDQLLTAQSLTAATPHDSLGERHEEMRETLTAATAGAEFDRVYIEGQIEAHQAALNVLNQASASAQNAELRNALQQAVPAVQEHLTQAQQLQNQLGATP